MSKILRWVLLVFGAAIIVTTEILLKGDLSNDVLTMNIIVSLIIWGTLFAGLGFPWIDLNDKSQKKVGSLGIFWFFTSLYALAAIIWMLAGTNYELSFTAQLIGHLVLLFVLVMGLTMSQRTSEKVKEVYVKETSERKGVVDIRKALASLKESAITQAVPEEIIDRIAKMCDDARYMSPSNNDEAHEIEAEIVGLTDGIAAAFFDYNMNEGMIRQKLSRCERLLTNRKQIHSL